MSDNLPSGPRIDRAALERVIRRAAELQAGEHDIGDGLTEQDLVKLGREVGIPDQYLQQALLEERTRGVVTAEAGLLGWALGPGRVAAQRAIAGDEHRVEAHLGRWMTEGELLQVKRRYPNQTSWEAQQGAFASLRRGLGFGGRRYLLAQANEVVGQVTPVDAGRCHVSLIADVSRTRAEHAFGGIALAAVGVAVTGVALVLHVLVPVAVIPAVLLLPGSVAVSRAHRRHAEHMQVALEQVLDRLEHGDTGEQPTPRAPRASAFVRIADELRKSFDA